MTIYHHNYNLYNYLLYDVKITRNTSINIDKLDNDPKIEIIWITDPNTFEIVFGGATVGSIFCKVKEVRINETE